MARGNTESPGGGVTLRFLLTFLRNLALARMEPPDTSRGTCRQFSLPDPELPDIGDITSTKQRESSKKVVA